MSEKFYNLECLQKHQNNPFIYVRKYITEENIISYKTIIKETKKLLECLHKCELEKNVGIAVDIKEHSAASCVLLLGILNLTCYFFCLDLEECKDVDNYLRLSGVKYIISSMKCKNYNRLKKQTEEIVIFNEIYFLVNLMSSTKNLKNVNLCYTIATSGSTGQPKMVHVPYDCILPNIMSLSSLLHVQSEDIVFLGSPPTFDPFVVEFFIALMNGTGLLITNKEIRLQPKKLLQILFPTNNSMKGITIYQTTPSLFRLFGTNAIEKILSVNTSLRCLVLGGEEFPSLLELKTWIPRDLKKCDKRIFNIYGITEISCWSSIFEIILGEYLNQKNNISIGKSLDKFTHFRIRDETGNILLNACKGELEIGSSIRCCFIPEYDKDYQIYQSQEIIYRKTGDIVERDELGNIFYIGRTNNTIKRMGKRINLDSLNTKIENLVSKAISFKGVTLWLKETMTLIYYVAATNAVQTDQKRQIRNILQHNLESYEQPDEIIYSMTPLPLNINGKVDRFKILDEVLKNMSRMGPTTIFKNFLVNVMGFNVDTTENEATHDKKRMKMISDISFTEAGGTSFQALSLASDMTKNMENTEDQRRILEMLLDNKISLNEILAYLQICENRINHFTCFCLPSNNVYSLKFTFKLMWRYDLKKCIDASPTIYKNVIAVGSHSHLLLVVDSENGKEISRIELPDRIECQVVFVTLDLAVVGCYDGYVYGFNYCKGSVTWRVNVEGMIKAKPVVIQNLVIVASYAEKYNVVAYDLKSLALKWRIKFGIKGIFSSPIVISEKLVLLCSLDGSYGLIESRSGLIQWQKKLDSPIFSSAAKIETPEEIYLILAEVKGQVTICKARNGEKITSYQVEGNIFSGINIHKKNVEKYFVIFGCHDKNVYCLNFNTALGNLTLFWKYFMSYPIFSTPITISYCYILCCSTKGMIVLLDADNAELMASYDLKAEIFSTPNCLNNKFVYLGSRDNNLYAFELM